MYFLEALRRFEKHKVDYAIVGGYAMALHGRVRGTIDLDLIIRLEAKSFEQVEKLLRELGYAPRVPVSAKEVFAFRDEYIRKRNLIAWSFYHKARPFEVIDIIITHDLKKMKTITKQIGNLNLKVLSIPDLIRMKKDSGRPQDLEDIKALEDE